MTYLRLLTLLCAFVAGAYVNGLRWESDYNALEASYKKAAEEQQAKSASAGDALAKATIAAEVVYVDRKKEVTKYVESSGVDCTLDDEFVRVFNGEQPARKP